MKANKSIRIGIDARMLLRPLRGIPLYVYRLAQFLPKARPEYSFIFFINRGFEHNDKSQIYENRIQEISQFSNVEFINANDDGELRWEQVLLPRLVKNSDVVLLHMPANRICFRAGVLQVVTLHDVIEYEFLNRMAIHKATPLPVRFWLLRKRAYVWLLYRFGIRHAHRIITVSAASAQTSIRVRSASCRQLTVINHGIDAEFVPDERLSSGPEIRQFCLMLGGDSYQKNPEAGIRAWARLPSALKQRFPLVIAGFVPNPNSPLLSAVERYTHSGQVNILGWVSQSHLVALFQSAAVFIFPSRCEGFGFPILQAMACGTPVVCSSAPALAELAGGSAWHANAEDIDGLSNGIQTLLTNSESWLSYRRAGLSQVTGFQWPLCAEQHVRLYESLLQRTVGDQ